MYVSLGLGVYRKKCHPRFIIASLLKDRYYNVHYERGRVNDTLTSRYE